MAYTFYTLRGEDGFQLLDLVRSKDAPEGVANLSTIDSLIRVWERHYEHKDGNVRFKAEREFANAPPGVESPYDPEARYRYRSGKNWVGSCIFICGLGLNQLR